MKKTGLVLGGGGAKGSYEIGVWAALRELGIEPEIGGVSGTSIGALNTVLYAQGDLELAQTLWRELSTKDIVHLDLKKLLLSFTAALTVIGNPQKAGYLARYFKPEMVFQSGILSQDSIKRMIRKYVNPLKIFLNPLDLYACCYKVRSLKAEYFSLRLPLLDALETILLASAAIPGAFNAVKINGDQYYDGGLGDNVPVRPLYDLGYRRFIVVNLNPGKNVKTEDFPDAQMVIITPQRPELFQGGLGNVLEFDPQTNYMRIEAGYYDAMALLKK